jgi:hypothetical protein
MYYWPGALWRGISLFGSIEVSAGRDWGGSIQALFKLRLLKLYEGSMKAL